MGRTLLKPVVAGQEYLTDIGEGPHEKLLGLKAQVEPDGSATSLTCCFTNGPAFRVVVRFDEMAPILNTIRQAANLMVNRSSWAPDGGARRLLELCATALRPIGNEVVIDPMTGDRLFILQFADHS